MKRPETTPAGAAAAFPDAPFAIAHPTLVEYLHTEAYEDGSAREKSTISIKSQDGAVLVVLNDTDLKRSLYCVGSSLGKALKSLEQLAASSTSDWRAWGAHKGKKK